MPISPQWREIIETWRASRTIGGPPRVVYQISETLVPKGSVIWVRDNPLNLFTQPVKIDIYVHDIEDLTLIRNGCPPEWQWIDTATAVQQAKEFLNDQ